MNHFSPRNRIKWKTIMGLMMVAFSCTMLTSIISLFFSNNDVQQEALETEMTIALSAKELHQRTSLAPDEIAALYTNDQFRVSIVKNLASYSLSADMKRRIENDEILTIPYNTLSEHPITLFMLGDQYMAVTVLSGVSLVRMATLRVYFTILLSLGLLTIFIVSAGGRIVRPLTNIAQAMSQVSKGDFSVRMRVHKNDELGILYSNFNQMVEELASIEYLQKDFISNVSHEFKTPIASISGYAKLLQSPELDENDKKEYTDIIISESLRLSHLSQNLLRLSKLENQTRLQNVTPFSLDEQLRMAILVLEPQWSDKAIDWDLELNEISYAGEQELLQQVWINLLSNAIKFSHQGGKISLRLYATDFIKVKIQDYGIGMTKEVQERIFEKFYQGDASHSEEGNGLGLSLAKRIVDLCGGTIAVKSIPNQQTTFTVSLPLTKS